MFPGKLATVIFLLYATTYPQLVTSECTEHQKNMILWKCTSWIGIPSRIDYPNYNSRCCKAVRDVPDLDLNCIALRLMPQEWKTYKVQKLLALKEPCSVKSSPPPPPPRHPPPSWNQVKLLALDFIISIFTAYKS